MTLLGPERLEAPIVEDQQLDAAKGAHQSRIATITASEREIAEHPRDALIKDRAVVAAGLLTRMKRRWRVCAAQGRRWMCARYCGYMSSECRRLGSRIRAYSTENKVVRLTGRCAPMCATTTSVVDSRVT